MVSTLALFANLPLVFFFALLAGYMSHSYRARKSPSALFLLISFTSIAVAYFSWVLRVIFRADDANMTQILPYWQVSYVGNAIAGYFLCVFGVYLGQPDVLEQKKWLYIAFLGPVVCVLIPILFFADSSTLQTFTGVTDLTPSLSVLPFLLIGVISLLIPIYAFLRFLATGEKGSFQYRRAKILLVGLVLVFLGLFIDAMKLTDDFPMFFVKIACATGAVILLYGFALFKEKTTSG